MRVLLPLQQGMGCWLAAGAAGHVTRFGSVVSSFGLRIRSSLGRHAVRLGRRRCQRAPLAHRPCVHRAWLAPELASSFAGPCGLAGARGATSHGAGAGTPVPPEPPASCARVGARRFVSRASRRPLRMRSGSTWSRPTARARGRGPSLPPSAPIRSRAPCGGGPGAARAIPRSFGRLPLASPHIRVPCQCGHGRHGASPRLAFHVEPVTASAHERASRSRGREPRTRASAAAGAAVPRLHAIPAQLRSDGAHLNSRRALSAVAGMRLLRSRGLESLI